MRLCSLEVRPQLGNPTEGVGSSLWEFRDARWKRGGSLRASRSFIRLVLPNVRASLGVTKTSFGVSECGGASGSVRRLCVQAFMV